MVLLGLTAASCLCTAVLFVNPQIFLNPFKPPVASALDVTPVATVSPLATSAVFPTFPPEWTATPSPEPSATKTASPEPSATETTTEGGEGFAPEGTATEWPSAVGPTATPSETAIPTRTPTRRPPTPGPTVDSGPYPGDTGTPSYP